MTPGSGATTAWVTVEGNESISQIELSIKYTPSRTHGILDSSAFTVFAIFHDPSNDMKVDGRP